MATQIAANPQEHAAQIPINVRHFRTRRGWRLDDLAAQLDAAGHRINPTALCRLENGGRVITAADLVALAAVFEVSLDDLFTDGSARELASAKAILTRAGYEVRPIGGVE